ncbi:MAG: hypothetical protein WCC36_13220, partial [Gammaproteobacteria bacterium]
MALPHGASPPKGELQLPPQHGLYGNDSVGVRAMNSVRSLALAMTLLPAAASANGPGSGAPFPTVAR